MTYETIFLPDRPLEEFKLEKVRGDLTERFYKEAREMGKVIKPGAKLEFREAMGGFAVSAEVEPPHLFKL